jgi:putative restriction endonuclease
MVGEDRLLIASHIKPWVDSNAQEKLDPKNGFMFTPTIDKLFDRGFITFDNDKKIKLTPWISNVTFSRLNLVANKTIEHLPIIGREKYLKYHRENIFKGSI